MRETAFTRGPWSWSFYNGFDGEASLMEGPEGDQHGSILEGVVFVMFDDGENLANANLIAAAPELYEALQKARNTLSGCGMSNIAADICDAALAKARGDQSS